MKFVRIMSLCLALFMLLAVACGCGKKEGDDTASETASGTPITVVKDGATDFIIIKSNKCTDNELDSARSVFLAYKEKMGVTIKNIDDDTEREAGTYEIIIGNTNRPESAEAKALLEANTEMHAKDFIVCALNGNIVIYAASDGNYATAVDYFISTYVSANEIAGDLCDVQKDTTTYGTISINGNTKLYGYSIVRSHYETSYLTQLELEKLNAAILDTAGYDVPIVEDAYVEAGDKEIIIGGSNREGQCENDDLDYYEIKVSGSKVYLDGGSDYAVAVAVTEFTNAVKAGNLTITDGIYKSGSYQDTVAKYDSSSYYTLKWSDEFNGSAIDENIWYVCGSNQMTATAPDGKTVYRGNGRNVYVKDGKLYQCAERDANGYYGGMLWTYDKMHFKYGYIETKLIIPDGDGFWVALWLQGYNWLSGLSTSNTNMYAEFDVIESFGQASSFTPSLHRWPTELGSKSGIEEFATHTQTSYQGTYANDRKIYCQDGGLFSDTFHTIGCLWTDETIKVTCDGVVRFEHDTTIDPIDKEAFNSELFIVLSLANYYSNCPVAPNATDWEWANTNKLISDYVRVFQIDGQTMTLF